MPPIAAVRGTHDVLPAQARAWEWLHQTHERVAASFGYQLVQTPIIEHTELFERAVGAGTDIVDKEMFTFIDRGNRSITLRPEGTAGVVRATLSAGLAQQARPLRVRYSGPMFRYDKPQRGRYRQFEQVGIECLGERSAHLDAEVIEVGVGFLAALGIGGVTVQVNTLGDAADRARFREALVAYYTPLRDQLCADCRRRLEQNPLRLLDCKADWALAEAAPRIDGWLSSESAGAFATVLADLDAAGIEHVRNHRLVRGLDYYMHTAFEVWHPSLQGAQNALGGGGRYDGLADELGLPTTPGVGYSFGVERLLSVAGELGQAPSGSGSVDVAVLALGPEQVMPAAAVARRLRAAGLRTALDASERRSGAKVRAAAGLGATVAVLIGELEVAGGSAAVRDLRAETQATVALDDLTAAVRAVVGSAAPVTP
jgi:histidyl-tRNA synthetase